AAHWWCVVPMLVTTTVDYLVALGLARQTVARRRGWLLGVSLAGNLGMLAYFKYSGLLVHTAERAAEAMGLGQTSLGWFEVVLPAGISFYTFQTLSYIIDLWRGEAPAPADLLRLAAFAGFFSRFVARALPRPHPASPA